MAKKAGSGVGREWLYDLMEKPVGRLYLLYGEETFRRDAAVGILTKRLVDPQLAAFNLQRFDGKTLTEEALTAALDRPPMMAERTLLLCFRPEYITVDGTPRRDLLVAVSPNRLSPEGRYDAIV